MKKEHLHLFIDDEIYVIGEKMGVRKPDAGGRKLEAEREKMEDGNVKSINKIKIAFIHNTDQPEELDLLNKIIAACNLDKRDFEIIKDEEEVSFDKAIVFTDSASLYYQPEKRKDAKIMNSKPLSILINSKEEKGRLWAVLQEFVG